MPAVEPAAQDLIEEVDVDVAELLPQFLTGGQLLIGVHTPQSIKGGAFG